MYISPQLWWYTLFLESNKTTKYDLYERDQKTEIVTGLTV